jgi:hypothetical protein
MHVGNKEILQSPAGNSLIPAGFRKISPVPNGPVELSVLGTGVRLSSLYIDRCTRGSGALPLSVGGWWGVSVPAFGYL